MRNPSLVFCTLLLALTLGGSPAAAQGPLSVTLSAPDVVASPGDTVVVDVAITALDNVTQLAAIKVAARFDSFVLDPVDAEPGALLGAWPAEDFSFTASAERLSVSALTAQPVAIGIGELLRLRFVVRDDAVDGITSPLDLTGTDPGQAIVLLARSDDEPPGIKTFDRDGSLTVTGGITCEEGDASQDGTLDVADAIVILRIVTGLIADPTGEQRCGADADRNGAIDTGDAVRVLRRVVGLPVLRAAPAASPVVRLERAPFGARLVIERASSVFGLEMELTGEGGVVAGELAPALRGLRVQSMIDGSRRVAWAGSEALALSDEPLVLELPVSWTGGGAGPASPAGSLTLSSLRLFDRDGRALVAEVESSSLRLARELASPRAAGLDLSGYPNPFNPSTTLSFELRRGGAARLEIFNAAGARVAVLVDDALPAGRHEVVWNGTDLAGRVVASGVYFARLGAEGTSAHRRLLLVK